MKTTYKNEQLKRKFYAYLKGVKQFSVKTIRRYETAIWLWEDFTEKDFSSFSEIMAEEFTEWLRNKQKVNSQEKISLTYAYHILRYLKLFFEWLSFQKGYRKINPTAIEYLQLTKKETREAIEPKKIDCPTLDEVKKVVETIRGDTEIEMRDKALFSLALLTGARIEAIMSLTMKSFNRTELVLYQNSRLDVRTKNSTPITTALIPFFYREALDYFLNWYDYLLNQKKFTPENPIFPMTKVENGENNVSFYNTGKVEPVFMKSQTSIRKIFEKRFKNAGVAYYHPHIFRHFLVKEISKHPFTEEQKKAFSQNFGHANTGTTFGSKGYGRIDPDRQIEIIKNFDFEGLRKEVKQTLSDEDINRIAKQVSQNLKNNT